MAATDTMATPRRTSTIIPDVVRQHSEDAAFAYDLRTSLIAAPHVRLRRLADFDERVAAHLDGLRVAGEHAWQFCDAALEKPTVGASFVAVVLAVERRDKERLSRLLALAEAVPGARDGMLAALEWVDGESLQGIVVSLLNSSGPVSCALGIAACVAHRVNPGDLGERSTGSHAQIRAASLRGIGELGMADLARISTTAMDDDDSECRFWASWSAVLLGLRESARAGLEVVAVSPGPRRAAALKLLLQTSDVREAHSILQELRAVADSQRWVVSGAGVAGNPAYVPWLLEQTNDDRLARLAGEAFSLITGADLEALRLERGVPQGFHVGPNDDPDDPNVDMDPDEGLPWPDPDKVKAWWEKNSSRFQPGTRYFMGAPVTREHCIEVLKNGYQRQRILAAHYLCLLEPGTPLFNTSAPAWRQKKLLDQMV
jgi:uncharacterized protein (TIGR02270 family)